MLKPTARRLDLRQPAQGGTKAKCLTLTARSDASGRAFISKPFTLQALTDKVRQVLGQPSPFARPSRSA